MLKIDLEELIMALESHDYDFSWYIERDTGKVIFVSGDLMGEEGEQPGIDVESERYLFVEPVPSSAGWDIMSDFVETLPEGEARRDLEHALQKRHPFRCFKDSLLDYPAIREQWFRFHEASFAGLAKEWLLENGIEAELV